MNEKGVEGRLRAAVILEICESRGDEPCICGSLRVAYDAGGDAKLDQAAEQIKALRFSQGSGEASRAVLLSDVLAVLAELRGDDGTHPQACGIPACGCTGNEHA